ncbi:thiamine pyrophosphate-dependent enzyme [Caldinitratiruptor microaerophilus]|uniref:Indolepyruvate oxidoreductase subunit IorA n=1 Tax=Caldinitratiruptor microaerophilus TaxID=671077 RepID=A0AA35CHU4_9FIRM|nr:thiamine pyrophosphate-dependent enzyme [Caldinitratiruptor microaerophilus]BDG59182.1 indolepyruvate ferredoxin oxidoreductase subunit alpha [Caldinitratiruptor microaerophilus]
MTAAMRRLLTGNEAIAHGAFHAGVGYGGCFPGGPTTEVTYTLRDLAAAAGGKPYLEWAINEKVALEAASGAAMSGVRSISVMKHFGVNNAADQLFAVALMGVPGLVLVVGDDPGGHSSHSEQDTRNYAFAAELPLIEPANPQEAYDLIQAAFVLSEQAKLPVYFRTVKWLSHWAAPVALTSSPRTPVARPAWDATQYETRPVVDRHRALHEKLVAVGDLVRSWTCNRTEGPEGSARIGVVAAGFAYTYVREALEVLGLRASVPLCKVATLNPLPEWVLVPFLSRCQQVLVVEEGEPLVLDRLKQLAHTAGLNCRLTRGTVPTVGELTPDSVLEAIASLAGVGVASPAPPASLKALAATLPERQPAPRAGNPHRATFYAVRRFIREAPRQVIFMGDVGEAPVVARRWMKSHATMGGGIGMAIGAAGADPDVIALTTCGDGTLLGFALGGLASAVYNRNRVITLICDNGTMESTGWQETATTGRNLTGPAPVLDIPGTLRALGLDRVEEVDARDAGAVLAALNRCAAENGPTAVVAVGRYTDDYPYVSVEIDEVQAPGLKSFVEDFACPALGWDGQRAYIDKAACVCCGDCARAAPTGAIRAIPKGVAR